jgi:hypothetical protein
LSYFQESLQHDASLADAREYLTRIHGDVIPEGLLLDAPWEDDREDRRETA